MNFDQTVQRFIELAYQHELKMLMVGGYAVNHYGYRRHSADVAFWISFSSKYLENLKKVCNRLGYEIERFPDKVKMGIQNISLKIIPDLI